MRDELLQLIRERTGLDETVAGQVTDAVMEFLRTKLPEPIAGMLESNVDLSQATNLLGNLGNLGGMFGKRD